MKRMVYIFIACLLVVIVTATGCTPTVKPDPTGKPESPENGTVADGQDGNEAEGTLIDSGRYAGKTGDFIAVKISGVPDEIEPREFKLSEALQVNFEQYGLEIDDVIKFHYTVSEQGEEVITRIEKLDD